MRPKPKGYISTFIAPTIITSNPEELANDSIYDIQSYDMSTNVGTDNQEFPASDSHFHEGYENEENFKEEATNEATSMQHPYQDIRNNPNESVKPQHNNYEQIQPENYEINTVAKKPYSGKRESSEKKQKRNEHELIDTAVSIKNFYIKFINNGFL